jgi:hypothetical protein
MIIRKTSKNQTHEIFFTLFSCLFILSLNLQSQDIIRLKSGDILKCKISKIDSANIYFEFVKNHQRVQTFIGQSEVISYDYKSSEKKINPNARSSKNDLLFLSFDPLGFITMGPTICGEFLFQGKNSNVGFGLYTGIRITNLGLASNVLLSGGNMDMSYTVPIAVRIYPKTRNKSDGLFLGPHFEFGKSNNSDGSEEKIRAFALEIGYKWVNKNGFTLELSDAIALIQRKKPYFFGIYGDNSGYENATWENVAFVPYMLSLKLGYTFH